MFDTINLLKQGAYIGSQGINSSVGSMITKTSPRDGSLLAQLAEASVEDYEVIMKEMVVSAKVLRILTAPKRGELIRLIGEALRTAKEELAHIITSETGKILEEARGEVQEMIDMADFCVGQSRMLYGKIMQSERPDHRLYEQWHPLGCVGIISAFNFPAAVWAWNAFIAIITGNVCIWKPSPKSPLTALFIHKLCSDIAENNGYPRVFSLLLSSDTVLIDHFISDRRVHLVSFTGSTKIGKDVYTKVANRMGRALLELGGNNAAIVDADVNIKEVVTPIIFSAVGTSGQRCTSLRRLMLHEAIYDDFLEQLISGYRKVKVADPFASGTLMGPLIDAKAVTYYFELIQEAKRQGGKVLYGGDYATDEPSNYVLPTLIALNPDSPLFLEEHFVPILFVTSYEHIDDAIYRNNQSAYGLSSAIFSQNVRNVERFLSASGSDCGIANVNISTSGAEIGGAFGGEKDSGIGREAGSDSWKYYMRRQTVTLNGGNGLTLSQGIQFDLS